MKHLLSIVLAALVAGSAWGAPVTPDPARLKLASANVVVLDAAEDRQIYAKAANEVTPIASVTKLMTAMVVLDAQQPLDETLDIDMGDFDYLKGSRSRLRMGTMLSRREMLRLALMSSENRAASSLARHYQGGVPAFVAAMNFKAASLGLTHTHYSDPTGLSPENVSTASDLAKLVQAAAEYPMIREFTTTPSQLVEMSSTGRTLGFNNSNALVKNQAWDITLQKTGYIREAGKCVVMLVNIASKPFVIVLLDSLGRYTRIADAQRVKYWLETGETLAMTPVRAARAVKVRATMRTRHRTHVRHGTFAPRLIKVSQKRY
ncbi:MAG TPA: D-alanyl-D-alanine endopeptidase [Casimicrobiaceae bacterium]|jgi:D-alanyl-D-alanine endopeptidase (penicillin-binding protein 7)